MSELTREVSKARKELERLSAAANRAKSGKKCRKGQHERRARQTMAAVTGHEDFRNRIKELTGHDLVHAGYHLFECIACGQWSIDDYCGEPNNLPVTPEMAKQLL